MFEIYTLWTSACKHSQSVLLNVRLIVLCRVRQLNGGIFTFTEITEMLTFMLTITPPSCYQSSTTSSVLHRYSSSVQN